jgi:hypothetical protein
MAHPLIGAHEGSYLPFAVCFPHQMGPARGVALGGPIHLLEVSPQGQPTQSQRLCPCLDPNPQ